MRIANMLQAVDAHAGGEPGRVIVGGVLDVPGATMFEKMRYLQTHADGLRQRMLREPRSYPAMCCNLILPPTRPEADAGFVIMEQVEYPGMSGTNTICVATVLLETGMLPMREPVTELTLKRPLDWFGCERTAPRVKSSASRFRMCLPLPCTWTPASRSRTSAPSQWMSRMAGCSTSSARPQPSGCA